MADANTNSMKLGVVAAPCSVDLTGLVITKLDGSAKAGVLFAIAAMSDINIPVHFIGVGESIDDLRDFEADVFVDALLKPGDD